MFQQQLNLVLSWEEAVTVIWASPEWSFPATELKARRERGDSDIRRPSISRLCRGPRAGKWTNVHVQNQLKGSEVSEENIHPTSNSASERAKRASVTAKQ